ncbi:HK97-gp10 family putative phage morphogenesis protein [Bacillus sp. FSL M8-0266]|uniref:HK97-gp10 family putative phage morphogenesis protein n=1 Tax=Bacillus TaxID=1386 RepID=UPI0031592385
MTGFDQVISDLMRVADDVQKVEDIALKTGGEIIAAEQRKTVGVSDKQQPHIKDNIVVSRSKENKALEKFVTIGGNGKVNYRVRFLEYGTSKMSPHPFIEKSADSAGDAAMQAVERILTGVIK